MPRLSALLPSAPLLLVVLVAAMPSRSEGGRVSCSVVIKEIDSVTGRRGSYRADTSRIARRLGVEPAWVERCAQIYGRRLTRSVPLGEEQRIHQQERWESAEPEERTGEDTEEIAPAAEPERRREKAPGRPTPGFGDEYRYD